ncbi:Arm DNA-binding domain-containing protein [Szabonella alba]|uniref:Arm DNA-binding domain-containing protein n=1 Tax=Szabonella alba TaxID=2804194 RepID=UPI001F2FAE55|nr:Arm DNA-binding domain-containing protein [Szabonella alba]
MSHMLVPLMWGRILPWIAKELSALEVKRLVHPGRGRNVLFPVGGVSGLALQITPTGARNWMLGVLVGGRRREIGLGAFPEVSRDGTGARS